MYEPTAYIGPVGSLVPFLGPSDQTNSDDRPVTFVDTLGGRKAFLGRPGRREWDCSLDARYPGELSGLMWLASYGNPPFVWYPADALFGNVLMPDIAGLVPWIHNGLEGPVIEVEPGLWVKTAMPDESSWLSLPIRGGSLDNVPVIPGENITVSAWLRGSNRRINVVWRDHAGVSGSLGNTITGFGYSLGLERCHTTLTVPFGAVQVSFQFAGDQVAGPAVTLTDVLLPYSPGKGAKRVVVHGLSETIKLVTQYPGARDLSGLSFTVSEVG